MKVERLTVNIRPMGAIQAMDLGFAMARAWYGELWWLSVYALRFWLIGLSLYFVWSAVNDWDMWAIVFGSIAVFSLARTVGEKRLMFFLSHKVFDDTITFRTLPALPSPAFDWRGGIMQRFLWHRRILMMAVRILENQTGKAATRRLAVLNRGLRGSLLGLTVVFGVMELILFLGGLGLLDMLMSLPYDDASAFEFIFSDDPTPWWLSGMVMAWYMMVVLLLMPFFVSASFAVYLCQRSRLEAWDLELSFYKIAQRFEQTKKTANGLTS